MSTGTLPASVLAIACIAAVLLAGCTGPAARPPSTPTQAPPLTEAPSPVQTSSFSQADDGKTYSLSLDTEIQLRLPENPTTGFTWNLSVTPGLSVLNDSYVPSDTTGKLIGSGGTHVWFLKAGLAGEQVISGLYRRPWEPAGNGSAFRLVLDVSEPGCGGDVCPIAPPTPSVPSRNPVYTGADNGNAVHEPLGGTFILRLAENPTTGTPGT